MMRAVLLCLSLLLAACSSAQPFRLLEANALAGEGGARFEGLEFMADTVPGRIKPRVNVIYLHGIGWTEDPSIDALGQEFLNGVAEAYGMEAGLDANAKCLDTQEGKESGGEARDDLLFVEADSPVRFETAIPGTYVSLDRLACVDRHTLDVSGTLDVVVYRIFWDDAFWNGMQFAHVGQDDDRGSSRAFAGLRRKYNRRLKDEIVNYGFSDAVMYLGAAGETIRGAVRGAVCAAALDCGGECYLRAKAPRPRRRPRAPCAKTHPF